MTIYNPSSLWRFSLSRHKYRLLSYEDYYYSDHYFFLSLSKSLTCPFLLSYTVCPIPQSALLPKGKLPLEMAGLLAQFILWWYNIEVLALFDFLWNEIIVAFRLNLIKRDLYMCANKVCLLSDRWRLMVLVEAWHAIVLASVWSW